MKRLMCLSSLSLFVFQVGWFSPVFAVQTSENEAYFESLKHIQALPNTRKHVSSFWSFNRDSKQTWKWKHAVVTPEYEEFILKKYGNAFQGKKDWEINHAFAEILKTNDLSNVFLTLLKHNKIDPNQQLKPDSNPFQDSKRIKYSDKIRPLIVKKNSFYTPLLTCLLFDELSLKELQQFFDYGAIVKHHRFWSGQVAKLPPEHYRLMLKYGFQEPSNIADLALQRRNKPLLRYFESRDVYPKLVKAREDDKNFYMRWVAWGKEVSDKLLNNR